MYTTKCGDAQKFLVLALKAALANGVIVKEEKDLIRKYCEDAAIDEGKLPDESSISMDELDGYFAAMDEESKIIIIKEVLRVMIADHRFDESECNFVYDLAERIGIAEEELNRLVSTI